MRMQEESGSTKPPIYIANFQSALKSQLCKSSLSPTCSSQGPDAHARPHESRQSQSNAWSAIHMGLCQRESAAPTKRNPCFYIN